MARVKQPLPYGRGSEGAKQMNAKKCDFAKTIPAYYNNGLKQGGFDWFDLAHH